MSGQPSGSNVPATPKAIASLAKKQPDVTRQGTQKLKFVPVLPARRKKDAEVKPEPPTPSISTDSDRGRGRGRSGEGRGRGAGPSPRTPIAMTASGPFAMGPALSGTSARRTAPRSNVSPIVPPVPSSSTASRPSAPSVKKEINLEHPLDDISKYDDAEVYSEQDDGVEIVDMESIRYMDWMAPESLRKDRNQAGPKKLRRKTESPTKILDTSGKARANEGDELNDIDPTQALDLSDEEEEEPEDLIEDFTLQAESVENDHTRRERLYFFQFPSPFPRFLSPSAQASGEIVMDVDEPTIPPTTTPDVSGGGGSTTADSAQAVKVKDEPDPKLDGIIGRLEVYRSGAVKMRIGNGIVLDVTAATQPSFFQHAVHLDVENKRLNVLGEVNKRFVVSPDVDTLLYAMELADQADANTASESKAAGGSML